MKKLSFLLLLLFSFYCPYKNYNHLDCCYSWFFFHSLFNLHFINVFSFSYVLYKFFYEKFCIPFHLKAESKINVKCAVRFEIHRVNPPHRYGSLTKLNIESGWFPSNSIWSVYTHTHITKRNVVTTNRTNTHTQENR